jgi:tetratricopeptide (TPR) repeat protein
LNGESVRIVVKLSSIQIWTVLCCSALFIGPATSAAQLGPDTRPTKGSSVSVPPKVVKETEKALRALQQNKLDDAQQYLENALRIDPNFADGNYLMGLLLLRRKESGRAVAYLQESLKLSPNHAAALLALGEAQYLEHDYADAIASLEKFLGEQPRSPQAPATQKYVDAMHKLLQQKTVAEVETLAVTSDSSRSGGDTARAQVGNADSALPPLPEVAVTTELNWAPPDVDAEKLDLDPSASCRLGEVMRSASQRVQELVQNVERYTATEKMEHFELSPMGLNISREARKFNYLVEIRHVGKSDLDVQEDRSGWLQPEKIRGYPVQEEFPGNVETAGIPMLALIFHPYFQPRYDFACEGRGSWRGRPAWVVHFRQRTDQTSSMLTYHAGNRSIAVGLKGRAWIDTESSQVVAMESDILSPVPEIQLLRDHQLVEYGPVRFRSKPVELWLPTSADWYCSLNGQRSYRRHTFRQFLLFSVDDKQEISKSNEVADLSEQDSAMQESSLARPFAEAPEPSAVPDTTLVPSSATSQSAAVPQAKGAKNASKPGILTWDPPDVDAHLPSKGAPPRLCAFRRIGTNRDACD